MRGKPYVKDEDAWYGVDFDGTIAKSHSEYSEGEVGLPIWKMIRRVKQMIREGKQVRIFTARADSPEDVKSIRAFLRKYGLPELEITNRKDHHMVALYDDKAVAVEEDTGDLLSPEIYSATLKAFSSDYAPVIIENGEAHASVIIVFAGQKIVLVERDEDDSPMLPAGHIDGGETCTEAASRELEEETGLVVPPESLIFVGAGQRDGDKNISFFTCELPEEKKVNGGDDVDEAYWHEVWNLPQLRFSPEDAIVKAKQVLSTPKDQRGNLIVFEGIDGSGKSTQLNMLAEYLKEIGIPYTVSKWNSSDHISDSISQLKKNKRLSPQLFFLLHAADMIARYENEIVPALERNEIVLCDRYFYTGLVRDAIRGVDMDLNRSLYRNLKDPSMVVYLDLDPAIAVDRLGDDRLGYYSSGMDIGTFGIDRRKSALAYETEMSKLYKLALPEIHSSMDATMDPDDIAQLIRSRVTDLIDASYKIDREEVEA